MPWQIFNWITKTIVITTLVVMLCKETIGEFVINGGFENGNEGWDNARLTSLSNESYKGDVAMKFAPDGEGNYASIFQTIFLPDIPTNNKTAIQLSLYGLADDNAFHVLTEHDLTVIAQFVYKDDNVFRIEWFIPIENAWEWTHLDAVFYHQQPVKFVNLLLEYEGSDGGGIMYIDEVSLDIIAAKDQSEYCECSDWIFHGKCTAACGGGVIPSSRTCNLIGQRVVVDPPCTTNQTTPCNIQGCAGTTVATEAPEITFTTSQTTVAMKNTHIVSTINKTTLFTVVTHIISTINQTTDAMETTQIVSTTSQITPCNIKECTNTTGAMETTDISSTPNQDPPKCRITCGMDTQPTPSHHIADSNDNAQVNSHLDNSASRKKTLAIVLGTVFAIVATAIPIGLILCLRRRKHVHHLQSGRSLDKNLRRSKEKCGMIGLSRLYKWLGMCDRSPKSNTNSTVPFDDGEEGKTTNQNRNVNDNTDTDSIPTPIQPNNNNGSVAECIQAWRLDLLKERPRPIHIDFPTQGENLVVTQLN